MDYLIIQVFIFIVFTNLIVKSKMNVSYTKTYYRLVLWNKSSKELEKIIFKFS